MDRRVAQVASEILPRVVVRMVGYWQVRLPSPTDPAVRRGDLVHAAVALHDSVPPGAREVHGDDGPELVGRRAGGLVLLDRPVPAVRRRARVVPDAGPPGASPGDGIAAAAAGRSLHV